MCLSCYGYLVFLFLVSNWSQPVNSFGGHFGKCGAKKYSFRVLYNVDLTKCKTECERRPACLNLSYRRLRKECSLFGMFTLKTGSDNTSCVTFNRNELNSTCVCPQGMACQQNGSCLYEECSVPPSIAAFRGIVSGNVLTMRSKVKVICKPGYVRIPDNKLPTCDSNGQWVDFPTCTANCSTPCGSFPYTESVSPGGILENALRTYTCKPGFYLRTNPNKTTFEVTCSRHRSWTYPKDLCVNGTTLPRTAYWIDGTFDAVKNVWIYSDGTQIGTIFWGPGEPSRDGECLVMDSLYDFLVNDVPCSNSYGYVCEYVF